MTVPTSTGKMGWTYKSILGLLHVATISKLLINLIAVNGQFSN